MRGEIDDRLMELDAEMRKCALCQDREHFPDILPTIQYEGRSNLLFVGREPAKDGWRKSGKAFYKKDKTLLSSGKNFKRHLDEVGIRIDDINFVELLKCFPSGEDTRPPKREEIMNCKKWLDRQIEIMRPSVIVPMGKECYEFFRGSSVTSFVACVEGKERSRYLGIPVVPILHPSGANNTHNWRNKEVIRGVVSEFGR